MLRLFTYQSPFIFLILFIAVILFRIPSFHPGFFNTDESYYLVSAERIAEGGIQYIDTIDNKPPILAWFYTFWVMLFGTHALLAIRIFTCLYLFLAALIFNRMVVGTRLISGFSILPGFLLIVLCSVPWYALELNGELLMLLPLILAFKSLMPSGDKEKETPDYYLFGSGILFGFCFMIKYQALFLFFGFTIAYILNFAPKFKTLFSIISGFLASVFAILLIIYFKGSLSEFWRLGVLYNLDYLRIGTNPGEETSIFGGIYSALKIWVVFFAFGLIGVMHFRSRFFTLPIRLRKTESILLSWLITGIISVLAGGSRLYLHYFILVFPPLAAYCARFFDVFSHRQLRGLGFYGLMTLPLLLLIQGFYCMGPEKMRFISGVFKENGWTNKMAFTMNKPHILKPFITPEIAKKGVFVLNFQPEIYLRLNARCATPFTNFSIAYYQFGFFPGADGYSLISSHSELEEIYRAFEKDMPAAIIDSWEENQLGELFPILQKKMPLLFAHYRPITAGKNRIYLRD